MNITIDSNELLEILKFTPPEQNIMLAGRHGIGKSQIITNHFESQGQTVQTLFLGQMSDQGDIIGLPKFNEETGQTEFMLPYWFPVDGSPVVLFLDELNRARPEVLQAVMDLTLNRKIAGKSLPEGSRVISAVNTGEEYQLTELDPALVSRFNIYTFVPKVSDWLSWAHENQIDERVIKFITKFPTYLDGANEAKATDGGIEDLEKTPDRRAWHKVSDIVKNIPSLTQNHVPLVAGVIGKDAALKFIQNSKTDEGVSGLDIVEKGEQVLGAVKTFSMPQIAANVDEIFEVLNTLSADDKNACFNAADNFEKYVDYLVTQSKEGMAYLVSVFQSQKYKAANAIVTEYCKNAYAKMVDFVVAFGSQV